MLLRFPGLHVTLGKAPRSGTPLEQKQKFRFHAGPPEGDDPAGFLKDGINGADKILLLKMDGLGDLPLMERKPLRRDHQLVLAVVVPPDDGDDPPCKVGQGRIHAQYVRVLFLAVAAHQPRDEPVIDGIQNIAVKISDRPIDLHRYDLAQQLPGAPASPVHHRPPVFLKSSTKRCHFTWSGAKSQA